MVVGKPFAGKSCALSVLEMTLSNMESEPKVLSVRINPKSISMK
jgi:hypothetical protein